MTAQSRSGKRRFYSGADHHHDIALVEMPDISEPEPWNMFKSTCARVRTRQALAICTPVSEKVGARPMSA